MWVPKGRSHRLAVHTDDAYFLQDLSLELLFPDSFGFITYQGSLSTPPCSETVTWILIDRALNITSLQVTDLHACMLPLSWVLPSLCSPLVSLGADALPETPEPEPSLPDFPEPQR